MDTVDTLNKDVKKKLINKSEIKDDIIHYDKNNFDVKVVSFSKGRHDKFLTTKFFDNLEVFVPENEADLYKRALPEHYVVHAVPSKYNNIVKTRQYVLDLYRDIDHFQIDDDVSYVWNLYELDTTANRIYDKNRIKEIINETTFLAKQLGCKIYGYCNIRRPLQYDGMSMFCSNGYINGSFCGYIAGHDYNYDLRITEGEDYYISAYSIYKDRYHFIDKRYTFVTDKAFTGMGGCSSYRSTETMKYTTIMLRKMFGDAIDAKTDAGLRKCVNQGERSFRKKF